jgi:hypothetical protein
MKTLKANDDGDKHPTVTPTVNAANGDQIGMLLAVSATLAPYLMTRGQENLEDSVDKEARLSACAAFIRAMDRLERMIGEDARWDVAKYNDITDSLNTLYKDQANYMRETAKAASLEQHRIKQFTRPSVYRKPTIFALDSGEFLMSDGSPDDPSAVKALGASPEEAATNFDSVFSGETKYEPFAVKLSDDEE